jgi:hypothetical protein
MSKRIGFIVILLLLLFAVNLYTTEEHFDVCQRFDKCSKYNSKPYSKCYNSGECSVMIDLIGNAFCTNKNP